MNAATTTYTYPGTSHKLSSLSGATTRSFTYDNAGNVTNSQAITHVYDGRGRMKQAGATTYLVNGLGQRVRKSSGSDLYFVYDEAGRLLGEYDATGAPIQETVWLGDVPVAVMKPATPSGFTLYYVWADHLGTPRMISDTANQPRWEWAHNDPFGNNLPDEDPAGAGVFAFNLRFPGQYYDAETGKHYNYFRDFDPAIGRCIQSDPIGLDGGLNTYTYVDGSPLGVVDPLGLRGGGGPAAPGTYYPRGRIDYRMHGYQRPGNAADAAGYFQPDGSFVCLVWNCPKSPNQCNPYDTKGHNDFLPAATDPTNASAGCTCAAPQYLVRCRQSNDLGDLAQMGLSFEQRNRGFRLMR